MPSNKEPGTLWVVATPIGNLADISQRAIDILSQVDVVAAEDTRHSRRLFTACEIDTPLLAYHEHNERQLAPKLVKDLQAGKNIALISDAGTPLISDPGYRLLNLATAAGIVCSPVPGACALIAALSISGLPSDQFSFAGFLPAKTAARKKSLQQCADNLSTVIFYESSHRIHSCLQDINEVLGANKQLVICRELTKTFETSMHGTAADLLSRLETDPNQQKGEFVILFGPVVKASNTGTVSPATKKLFTILCEELPASRAAKLTAKITGAPRKSIFTTKKGQSKVPE